MYRELREVKNWAGMVTRHTVRCRIESLGDLGQLAASNLEVLSLSSATNGEGDGCQSNLQIVMAG